jgi:proteasome lid subunit RPN8/RPN11
MADSYRLTITEGLAEKIRQHGVEAYPHECCGALLGRDQSSPEEPGKPREILDLFPLINRREDSPRNRFSVSPRDVIDAEKEAQERGLDIVGWYHSHPDHPARPSEYDREHAWPWYSYIIVSIRERVPQEMTSWRLKEDRAAYSPEEIHILDTQFQTTQATREDANHGR